MTRIRSDMNILGISNGPSVGNEPLNPDVPHRGGYLTAQYLIHDNVILHKLIPPLASIDDFTGDTSRRKQD